MKRYFKVLLIGISAMLSLSLTSCHEDEDLGPSKDKTKIVFNRAGEPEYEPVERISDSYLQSHLGRIASLSYFLYIQPNGTTSINGTLPSRLYGIADPKLYLKDKETLIVFNEQKGVVSQYKKIKINIDLKTATIRSDGKFVAQLRKSLIDPSSLGRGLFYYGEADGESVYASVSISWSGEGIPADLTDL